MKKALASGYHTHAVVLVNNNVYVTLQNEEGKHIFKCYAEKYYNQHYLSLCGKPEVKS